MQRTPTLLIRPATAVSARQLFIALMLAFAIAGCGGGDSGENNDSGSNDSSEQSSGEQNSTAPKVVDGVVQMDRQGMAHAGIKLAKAEPAQPIPLVSVPAMIAPPLGSRRAVAAPYPGVVREVRVVEGQPVRKGQVLAVVVSPTVMQTGADLQRARAQLDVSRSSAYRTRKLVDAGIIAGARAEEARATLRQAETTVAENRRLLGLAHADATSGTYTLVAPFAGRVSAMNVTLGQPIDNSAAPFVIDAEGAYGLTAQLPQDYAGKVHAGMQVRIPSGVTGTITAVGMTVDPDTRAVPMKARVDGAAGVMSGKSLMATVLRQPPADAVQVPADALVQIKDRCAVFVPKNGGFAPRAVQVVGRSADRAVITGLPAGAIVVGAGVSELKSALTSG